MKIEVLCMLALVSCGGEPLDSKFVVEVDAGGDVVVVGEDSGTPMQDAGADVDIGETGWPSSCNGLTESCPGNEWCWPLCGFYDPGAYGEKLPQ
jgi:hypothetical protein